MITYTTNLDNEAYAKLFEEIAELGGPKIENFSIPLIRFSNSYIILIF